jgi:hypothetical protein
MIGRVSLREVARAFGEAEHRVARRAAGEPRALVSGWRLDVAARADTVARILAGGGAREDPNAVEAVARIADGAALYDFFDRVVVINLERRRDRLEGFQRRLAAIDWPFRTPERVRAVDGRRVKPPAWWRAGAPAWGCQQSHLRVLEDAQMDDVRALLVLEDDVVFAPTIRGEASRFLGAVPEDWDQLYLGGQHLRGFRRARIVNAHVVRPFNVNRTHAYGVNGRFLRTLYRYLTDYVSHAEHPRDHIDHRLGSLHETGEYNVYAPTRWLCGQMESSSDILGRRTPTRFWNGHSSDPGRLPFVAVVGLHRSGSSCLAGVLHHLGVHMGDELGGHEPSGGFEARGLAAVCEAALPFPSTEPALGRDEIVRRLRVHVAHVCRSAARQGKAMAGGKYPHLCALGPELQDACGDQLRVVNIERSLDESIASLRARSRAAADRWLAIDDVQADHVQRWLLREKRRFLGSVPHLDVALGELVADPRAEIERLVAWLALSPSDDAFERAVAHVRPELLRHRRTAGEARA